MVITMVMIIAERMEEVEGMGPVEEMDFPEKSLILPNGDILGYRGCSKPRPFQMVRGGGGEELNSSAL